jgi:hypothetical protein
MDIIAIQDGTRYPFLVFGNESRKYNHRLFVGRLANRTGRDSLRKPAQSGHNQPLVFPYRITADFSVLDMSLQTK